MKNKILSIYSALLLKYGEQGWWPISNKNAGERDRAFEISIGAILTQNTAWKNVEKALNNLIEKNILSPELILKTSQPDIAECIKPSGYYNQKAERLRIFSEFFLKEFSRLKETDAEKARQMLLGVKGIGPETADSILLYALNKPVFVIDAYTKRMFSRILGVDFKDYGEWQDFFHKNIKDAERQAELFNEFHALIVEHCKSACRKEPDCEKCSLSSMCKAKFPNSVLSRNYFIRLL